MVVVKCLTRLRIQFVFFPDFYLLFPVLVSTEGNDNSSLFSLACSRFLLIYKYYCMLGSKLVVCLFCFNAFGVMFLLRLLFLFDFRHHHYNHRLHPQRFSFALCLRPLLHHPRGECGVRRDVPSS